MDCPGCNVEMVSLEGEDITLRKCGECSGLSLDVADLNRVLLHNNLPGLESQGGKVDPQALTGSCPDCQVDFIRVEGGDRHNPLHYDTCESCGGIFLEEVTEEPTPVTDAKAAFADIVDFFRRFSAKRRAVI